MLYSFSTIICVINFYIPVKVIVFNHFACTIYDRFYRVFSSHELSMLMLIKSSSTNLGSHIGLEVNNWLNVCKLFINLTIHGIVIIEYLVSVNKVHSLIYHVVQIQIMNI